MAKTKVLITGDVQKVNSKVWRLLKGLNLDLSVVLASDEQKVIDHLNKDGLDLILCDLTESSESDQDICETIQRNQSTKNIPLIFYTNQLNVRDKIHNFDIIHQKLTELEETSSIDPVTNIYNRRYLEERFNQEIASCQRHQHLLSCFMIDIDNFKFVNDHYGHPFGDYILAEVAHIIEDSCRLGDIVSRFGGEEFVVLLPQTDQKGALVLGERVRESIDKHVFQSDNHVLHLTVSIGITTTTNDMPQDHCQQTLLKQADTALYEAKRNGKNQVVEWHC